GAGARNALRRLPCRSARGAVRAGCEHRLCALPPERRELPAAPLRPRARRALRARRAAPGRRLRELPQALHDRGRRGRALPAARHRLRGLPRQDRGPAPTRGDEGPISSPLLMRTLTAIAACCGLAAAQQETFLRV